MRSFHHGIFEHVSVNMEAHQEGLPNQMQVSMWNMRRSAVYYSGKIAAFMRESKSDVLVAAESGATDIGLTELKQHYEVVHFPFVRQNHGSTLVRGNLFLIKELAGKHDRIVNKDKESEKRNWSVRVNDVIEVGV